MYTIYIIYNHMSVLLWWHILILETIQGNVNHGEVEDEKSSMKFKGV